MKKIFISISMLLAATIMYGQAREGWVESQKKQQPAAVIELPYAPDVVNAAMTDHLSKKGRSRATDIKGFTTFRNTASIQNDSVNADMYFKVERKNRQEKGTTVVSLLVNAPEAGAATSNTHHLNMEQAKVYLNELVPAIDAYNLELVIKDQNETLTKAESKLKALVNDAADLQEKKTSIERKLEENKARQQEQMNEVESQKQKLATWVSQRKS
ncbi:MAG TPA: hypothetical protein VD996_00950 [Chitinophagaceae bacterium]|nr:hypothetical protein [Chitinophagaceae bacterium]